MTRFYIHMPMPTEYASAYDRVLQTAIAFLQVNGPVERMDVLSATRATRKGSEILPLVVLTTESSSAPEQDAVRGGKLEDVLRAALGAAGIKTPEPRVYVVEE
ncbi:MAG: hypothetical protein OZ928_20975 [Polyangiaceae bacterium]|nr:hypothetical protein [Polyangiaceae bacterium]